MMPQSLAVGSPEHRELLCRFFLDSHVAFDPTPMRWPELDGERLAQLRRLPFWAEALATERMTARTIQAWARLQTDPLLHEAIALQAYEEQRHADLLQGLTTHYEIPIPPLTQPRSPVDPEWAFLCTGYSECCDAFFTFGLFILARDSGFFPPALIECFEPVMQEEARHILFFVNWEAYYQAQRPFWQRPRHLWRGVLGRGLQLWHRLQMARGIRQQGDFTLRGHESLPTAVSPRQFLRLCLSENERRLGGYDGRLLRPRLVPGLASALARILH